MQIVGITGGVASGKSLVFHHFMKLGAYGIDCDQLSREAVIPCSKAWWETVRLFGTEILKRDLEIDRKKLREIVFNDREKRKALEQIIHPEVQRMCQERIEAIREIEPEHHALVVIDVPLLIEAGVQDEFDTVIVVYVSEETQIRRVMERDRVTREEARKLIALQMPLMEKLTFADIVISNEGSREDTERQVSAVFKRLTS